jgi:Dicarboxylate transport
MRRAWRYIFGSFLLLAALGAGVVLLRTELLEFVLERGLAYAGVAQPRLRVTRLEWTGVEFTDIHLGSELQVADMQLEFRPAELWHGKLRRLALDAPVVDLTRDGALQRLLALSPGGRGDAQAPALPPISIENGELRLASAFGPVLLRIDGTLREGAANAVQGRFNLAAEAELGRLAGNLAVEAASDGRLAAELHVDRGDLSLAGLALAGVQFDANFARTKQGRPSLAATGSVTAVRFRGERAGETTLKIGLDGDAASLQLQGTAFGAPFNLSAAADIDLDRRRLNLKRLLSDLALSPADSLPARLGLPKLLRGRVRTHVIAGGVDVALADLPTSLPAAVAWLQRSRLDGSATLNADGLAIEGWCERADLVLGANLRAVDGRLEVTLAAPLLAEVDGVAPDWLAHLPLPVAGPAVLEIEPGTMLSLAAGDRLAAEASGASGFHVNLGRIDAAGVVTLDASLLPRWNPRQIAFSRLVVEARDLDFAGQHLAEGRYQGMAALQTKGWRGEGIAELSLARFTLGPVAARHLEAELPLAFDAGSDGLELTGPGRLHLIGGHLPEVTALPERIDLVISPGKGPLLQAGGDDVTVNVSAALPQPISLTLQAGRTPLAVGTAKLALAATLTPPGWKRIDARLRLDSLGLPRESFIAKDLALDLSLNGPAPSGKARLSVASIASLDPALPRLSLSLDGSAEVDHGRGGFEATLAGGDGLVRARADGRFDLAAREATATAALSPLRLDEVLSLLKDTWPVLAPVTAMSGRAAADMRLAWRGDEVTDSGTLTLEELSLATTAFGIRGLSGRIALDRLWPPEASAAQRITVQNVSGPVAVRDAELLLRLEPIAGRAFGRVVLERADAEAEFAHLQATEGIFDPVADSHQLALRIDDLDLAKLLALLKVDGLSGTGSLTGSLRAEYADGKLIIPPARLASIGPGVIRFTSAAAKRALASGGEQVALLLKALEDFHYETLTLGLEKRADGSGQAKLSLRGSNPEVLDGYPFALNIDLGADFDSLLATLRQAYDLSGRALRATVK